MKRIIAIAASLSLLVSCAAIKKGQEELIRTKEEARLKKEYSKFGVDLTKHPDYNFGAGDHLSIKIYDKGFTPLNSDYVVIGKVFLAFLPDANQVLVEETIKKAAAFIGGQGLIFIDEQSQESGPTGGQKTAMLIPFSNMMFYQENTSENNKITITKKVANVIRWR